MQWSDRVGRRLKLRDLHIVLAVAESGSMAKAAADLAISQPSVSKAIAEVEHVLGLRLFDRGPKGIEPTAYGRALVKCGVAVFDELRQGVKKLEFLVDPAAGELRIGCNETLAAGFVSAIIERLSRQYPGSRSMSCPQTATRCSAGSCLSAPSIWWWRPYRGSPSETTCR